MRQMVSVCDDHASILDVGCNDGLVAEMMMQLNPTLRISGVDVQSLHRARIPKVLYDGSRLPYADGCFDVVMAIDVLHHSHHILPVLEEMKRVAKKYLVIKDQTANNACSRYMISWSDYLANLPYGIECVFNFPSHQEWRLYFEQANLRMVEQPRNLYYGFGLTERYNPIFKLEKQKEEAQ